MAIQFPNFLGVPVRTPDYSGLGDAVNNYYAGKAMPKDDLIKAIQAEFARPTAEENLRGLKLGNTGKGLSNRKEQLDIDKLVLEANQQKAFEQQLRQALGGAGGGSGSMSSGGGGGGSVGAMPSGNGAMGASQPMPQAMNPSLSQALSMPQQSPMGAGNAPNLTSGVDLSKMTPIPNGMQPPPNQVGAGFQPPMNEAAQPADSAPLMAQPAAPAEQPLNEITITKGTPHLAGVDQMWESNPLSRQFLEKKGYKKTQEIKFDNKTGKTTILTKYPSGRITVQSSGGVGGTGEAPLTTKMVSKHQNIISSIDNAEPIIQKILSIDQDEKGKEKKSWEPYPRSQGSAWYNIGLGQLPGFQSQSTKYEALVSSALDSLIGAYGLPMTNEGLETVKKQLMIGHGETDATYRKRLKELLKDLQRRKEYSATEVKKTLKNPPTDNGNGQSYSSDDWEVADDQQ